MAMIFPFLHQSRPAGSVAIGGKFQVSKTGRDNGRETVKQKEEARPHQPGQAVFKSILSEDIDWKPFASFPPSARLAVVVGQPSDEGPYTIRVKVPHGVKLMPHKHPEDRVYTVISGVFYIGLGDQFDPDKLQAYSPGSVIVLPGNTSHFHWARSGEYITQVTGIGPLGLDYVNPEDDPRNG
jgi:quercetin dioxygenase-like cupin family protein